MLRLPTHAAQVLATVLCCGHTACRPLCGRRRLVHHVCMSPPASVADDKMAVACVWVRRKAPMPLAFVAVTTCGGATHAKLIGGTDGMPIPPVVVTLLSTWYSHGAAPCVRCQGSCSFRCQ
jgi:hypothetical protein